MKFSILGSGSSANAYYFSNGSEPFLIDNGFSFRQLSERLITAGSSADKIRRIFITHTHSDHVKGLGDIMKRLSLCEICLSRESAENLKLNSDYPGLYFLEERKHHTFPGLDMFPFSSWHDVSGSLGFYFKVEDIRYLLLSDTGCWDESALEMGRRADVLFLESNYCDELLERNRKYPPFLKQRIRSNTGHLSNNQAIEFARRLIDGENNLKHIYLCHLSENNNTPETVEALWQEKWKSDIPYTICPRNTFVAGCF